MLHRTHHGREIEAQKVLCRLRNLPPGHELIDLEFLEIKAQSVFDKRFVAEKWPGLSELTAWNTLKLQFVAIGSLFSSRGMFRRVIVATITMVFQQFTGINAGKLAPSAFVLLAHVIQCSTMHPRYLLRLARTPTQSPSWPPEWSVSSCSSPLSLLLCMSTSWAANP